METVDDCLDEIAEKHGVYEDDLCNICGEKNCYCLDDALDEAFEKLMGQ